MSEKPSPVALRDHLVRALRAELVGPYDLDGRDTATEVLPLPPSRWYFAGFLASEDTALNDDPTAEDEGGGGDDVDDGTSAASDAEVDTKRARFFPTSMGLSLLLPPGTGGQLPVTIRFAEYHRIDGTDAALEIEGERKRKTRQWKRVPYVAEVLVPLNAAALGAGVKVEGHQGLKLKGRLEETTGVTGLDDGTRALALFLTNERAAGDAGFRDEAWLFQVEVEVHPPEGLAFVARPNPRSAGSGEWDEQVADLQFRAVHSYGVGHGVAIEESSEGAWVRTCWIPEGRVAAVRTRSDKSVTTSMEALAGLNDGEALREALLPLVDAYSSWIAAQRGTAVSAGRELTRDHLMDDADAARDRIAEGIERLATDTEARRAFTWMNAAMAVAARQRSPERYADGSAPSWRLFQLAFVLLNICSIDDEDHKDRDTVELIFFPTGGGKTEAYLGVIGFTLLLRRLHGASRPDRGLGVAVVLRYTLRLLTLDQLGRAATLICALERLRRKNASQLGDVRFAIGLWVGRSATANTLKQVTRALTDFKNGRAGSPFPLTECPWCRTELKAACFSLQPSRSKPESVEIGCYDRRCDFNQKGGGLPVLFVDEQIYRELPSFLLATVDKFAMLPWRGETGALFGRVHSRDGRRFFGPMDGPLPNAKHTPIEGGLVPPELIVQDEVHLISGPLGTMVGLYETAIDRLCRWTTVSGAARRPKVLASTATVRRASDQMKALFGRTETRVFPPPGIDDGESFFAERDPDSPDRRYVGVAAPGQSFKAVQLRTFVTLLGAAQYLTNHHGAAADAWMTVVGYYNSLRELGGMRRLVEDDVRARLWKLGERLPLDRVGSPHRWVASRGLDAEPVELTSRESTARIAKAKSRLGVAHGDKNAVDVALATNMISVGLDIDRLGLMVVAGQPKTTAEYIQASSRVGRDAKRRPGLVATCLNLHRPRDRSHYEHFSAYHASFYRYVEVNSLTPFSAPALDRGLAGMLVALARLTDAVLTPPRAAEAMPALRDDVESLIKDIADRAGAVTKSVDASAEDELVGKVTARCMSLLDSWQKIVEAAKTEEAGKRCYSALDRGKNGKAILTTALDDDALKVASADERRFTAPTSMRDVEPSVHVWLNLRPESRK
jgi:hypothetical protein